MDLSEIASVTGKSGLFKVVSPTRSGVILEAMDGSKKKMVASVNNKVSILSDISIYTTDKEGATPLSDVMMKIHAEFNGDTDLTSNSSPDELKSFLKFILPEYDESRVYVSDIKKLVTWYNMLSKSHAELFVEEGETSEGKQVEEKNDSAPESSPEKEG